MLDAGKSARLKCGDFGAGQKCGVTTLHNWPGVCWPNDGGGNGHVSHHGVLC